MSALDGRALMLLAAGGALGAVARYATSQWLTREYPWGTVAVNVAGSFLIGAFMFGGLARGAFGPEARLFFAVGFLGALTTMSSFAYEFVALLEDGEPLKAAGYFLLNPVLAVGGVLAGRALGLALAGGGGP